MDSTLALGAFRIARGAGGEAVDVNGNLVEREKHHLNLHLNLHLTSEWAVPRVAGRFSDSETSWVLAGRRGQFSVQSDNRFSGRGGGVGSLPRAWRRVGSGAAGAKKNCEIGVGFSFAALSVFRLRRAEAASALWIPHWHWEPCESQGARAAKRYVNGNLVEREKGDVWNRNSCVLIDYRLWAAKSEGRQWVDHCIDLYVDHCIDHHPEPPRRCIP